MKSESDKNLEKELNDFMQSDIYKKQEELRRERMKTVKSGNDVVHLEYVGELNFSETAEIESILAAGGLRLSSYDKSGLVYACLDQFTLTSSLLISSTLLNDLLFGLSTNAAWDAIKWSAVGIWTKVKERKVNKIQSGKIVGKEITFGLKVYLDKNTGINMQLSGNVSEEVISESLDKALDFLREQGLNQSYKIEDFAFYHEGKKQWKKVDVMVELQKLANKKTVKSQKQQETNRKK